GPPLGQFVFNERVLWAIDTAAIAPLAREHAQRGVWQGPTLALFHHLFSDSSAAHFAQQPLMRYAPKNALASWTLARDNRLRALPPASARAKFYALRDQMVRTLHREGVRLLAGSDSPFEFYLPGDALIREIEALALAGLSPYAAREAATRTPAASLGDAAAGTVAAGPPAHLVLPTPDPLRDVR